MSGFRPGVRVGVDVGKARIGVARSDMHGMLATPVETVPRASGDPVARIIAIAHELDAFELVVGLPLSMSGGETASTADAREFATLLAVAWHAGGGETPVRMVDERLSTVSAHAALRGSGRSQRSSRSIIDQVAAVVLLQHAIDTENLTGNPLGATLQPPSRGNHTDPTPVDGEEPPPR